MPIWRSALSRRLVETGVTTPAQAPPRRSPVLLFLFRLYLRWFFWRRFEAVRVLACAPPVECPGRPMVIYCNHPSWWDPALMLLAIPKYFPARRAFGPMDAAALRRYGLLQSLGVFGIDMDHPKSAARFLRVTRDMLRAPDMCLCITAEGAFTDPRLRPVKLRRGLAHLASSCPDAVFVPMALEYSFWNESKPEALLAFGKPVTMLGGTSLGAWQTHLEQALTQTMDLLADASAQRSPDAFRLVLRGTAGVGGIYDLWRRARAMLRGQTFDARHQPGPPG
jgi:1-acyl-sn-glycerol-3-phosphate acyltransferase